MGCNGDTVMQRTTFYCDGCKRKLEGEKLVQAQKFSADHNRLPVIFCPESCIAIAELYWEESDPVNLRIVQEADRAILNFRGKFFSSRQRSLKEVM